jgi:hypothetical protein
VKLTTEALAANLHNQQIKMIESWRGGSGGGAAGGNVFCKVLRRSSRCATRKNSSPKSSFFIVGCGMYSLRFFADLNVVKL